jgi:AcrR family transcriptional regulator
MTTRRENVRKNTLEEIKVVARQQMAEQGTAGISLRAIASQMGMTAPALYRYYASRDDLITALIVDGFTSLGKALNHARDSHPDDITARIIAVATTYREWALANPTDFQLIYGNPIPGYHAPREVTVPASVFSSEAIVRTVHEGIEAGLLVPQLPDLPPAIYSHIETMLREYQHPISPIAMHIAITMWGQGHGLIMLEMFGHIGPLVGDTTEYYHYQLIELLKRVGWHIP